MVDKLIYGVDFSGSKSPGNDIWLTEARIDRDATLDVCWIKSASEQFDCHGREQVFTELREFIKQSPSAIFGLDFPFGLPQQTVDQENWESLVEYTQREFTDSAVEEFIHQFGNQERPKRDTDYRHAGQSPLSPQLKYQSFYGLRDIIAPLVMDGDACVLPMQKPYDTTATLSEIYPAATFGRLGCYRTGYKTGPEAQRRRRENMACIKEHEVAIEEGGCDQVISSDDALDSLCAAVAVRDALSYGLERDLEQPVEGFIYSCPLQPGNPEIPFSLFFD